MIRTCSGPLVLLLAVVAVAAEEGPVLVTDYGRQERISQPGAPPHIVGLLYAERRFDLDNGRIVYGLRWGAAVDEKLGGEALPGEGYIGMSRPTAANWYHGGFLDLILNGRSIGRTIPLALTARGGERGYLDMVFDTPQALARVRFLLRGGDDSLFCQVRIEPKEAITAALLNLRCYPSAFITTGARRVLTPVRELVQGEKAALGLGEEWWLFYYDALADLGKVVGGRTGAGPCAVVWLPEEMLSGECVVGSYAVDTRFALRVDRNEWRLAFLDYAGKSNAAAQADLQTRAEAIRADLEAMDFDDPSLLRWPLADRQAEAEELLATLPAQDERRAQFEAWARELVPLLERVHGGRAGMLEEARAAELIQAWDAALPELRLHALLERI